MRHRLFLKPEILKVLKTRSSSDASHSEYDLEAFFVSQGYNLDDIQDGIDHMISEGQIDFTTDTNDGDQLVCLITAGG